MTASNQGHERITSDNGSSLVNISSTVAAAATSAAASSVSKVENSDPLDNTIFLYQNQNTGTVSTCRLSLRQICRILSPPIDALNPEQRTTSTSIITPDTNLLEYDSIKGEYSSEGWKIAKSFPILRQACASWYYTTTTTTDNKDGNSNGSTPVTKTIGPVSCRQLANAINNGTLKVTTSFVYSPCLASTSSNSSSWQTIENLPELRTACQAFSTHPHVKQQEVQEQPLVLLTEPTTTSKTQPQQDQQNNCLSPEAQQQQTNGYDYSMMVFDDDNNDDDQPKPASGQDTQQNQIQDELEAFLSSTSHLGNNVGTITGKNEADSDDDYQECYESDGGTKYVKEPRTGNWIHHALATQQKQQEKQQKEETNKIKRPTQVNKNDNVNSVEKNPKKRKKAKFSSRNAKCWIYITGLPTNDDIDITQNAMNDVYKSLEQEIFTTFSKVGIIDLDPETQKPKIKLYRDKKDGSLKGDASLCYARPESVQLALNILDESQFVFESKKNNKTKTETKRIRVQPAKFEQHGEKFESSKKQNISNAKRKVVKLAARQAIDWDDGEFNGRLTGGRKGLRIIVLRHIFRPTDLVEAKDEGAILARLENDIRNECEKYGAVEKITIFSNNPDGVVVVKYTQPGAASEAVQKINGRLWNNKYSDDSKKDDNDKGNPTISATFWDGVTDFTCRDEEKEIIEMEKRHEEFGNWLDNQHEELPEEFKLQVEG